MFIYTDLDVKSYKVLLGCCLGNLASGFPINSFGTVLTYIVSYLREVEVQFPPKNLDKNVTPPQNLASLSPYHRKTLLTCHHQWRSKGGRWGWSTPGGTFRGAAKLRIYLKTWEGKIILTGKNVRKGVREELQISEK